MNSAKSDTLPPIKDDHALMRQAREGALFFLSQKIKKELKRSRTLARELAKTSSGTDEHPVFTLILR
jgi:hypothetical protein